MYSKTFILCILIFCLSCNNNLIHSTNVDTTNTNRLIDSATDTNPYSSINAIPLPVGFTRIAKEANSFADWLLTVKLKKDKTVYTFDGTPKANQTAQFAVLDISVGNKNLQQCADAVMRLRAEYLFAAKKFQDIHFTDNEGKMYQFEEPYNHEKLQLFLQKVFAMCGSASLSKQLNSVSFKNIQPGDVIIRGGFPGHAVLVMDVAINKEGEKVYLLAQSYMPAQDIHVLANPGNKNLSPWYAVDESEWIQTPEYTFTRKELKSW
jgi:Domain of unknown function (4846)